MDTDFWSSRIAAAKRQFSYSQRNYITVFDRLSFSEYVEQPEDVEEVEIRQDFPCPYCYEDYDVVSLCSHIEDEHSAESRIAACPVCSVKVTSDMISHITLLHSQLFKHMHRRRRLRRLALPNNHTLSVLGRDLREAHLKVLLGGGGNSYKLSNTSTSMSNASATDPFLSSLIMNFPNPEVEDIYKAVSSTLDEPSSRIPDQPRQWKIRFDPSLSYEERQRRIKQVAGRAEFMQDLFLTTLLQD